jgi:hypothetical protein
MRTVDFFALPPGAQDKFLAGCRGELDPKAILFRPGTRTHWLAWLLLPPAAFGAAAALALGGLGELDSPWARQPAAFAAVYVLLAAAFAFGVLQALAYRAVVARLPYRAGVYLFEAAVIDARDRRLRAYPLGELGEVSRAGATGVALRFGARSFVFPVAASHVAQALQLVHAAHAHMTSGLDDKERRLLDPLEPPLVLGPFASTVPLAEERPIWVPLRWVFALAFGGAGVLAFSFRDDLSDARMFAAAKASDDVSAYDQYLAHGDDHRDVVDRELRPRAALRLAIAAGTVEAIDAFAQENPATAIAAEVDAARRSALEATFARSTADGSLAALLDFAERYPGHHLEGEWKAARHAIYAAALERYRRVMPTREKATGDFVERLLEHAARQGPERTAAGLRGPLVEVRMRRVASRALQRADELVKRNPYYVGELSLPTRYFDATHLEPLEQPAARSFAETLQSHFPADIITFAPGAPVEGSGDTFPEVTKPTLWVSYRVEPSGVNYASQRPRGIYLGMVFFIRVDFVMPTGGERLVAKHMFARNVPVDLVAKHDESARASLEKTIYADMAKNAFDELHQRYFTIWFDSAGKSAP